MFCFNWISSLGLVIDIIGVCFIFWNGLPSKIEDFDVTLSLGQIHDEEKIQVEKKNKRIKKIAKIGLILILVGFVLQLIGTNTYCS